MPETEICDVVSDVAGVENKSELEIISSLDNPEPPCSGIGDPDQSSDPENSYVFVAKADSRSDDLIYSKEVASVDSLESKASDQFSGVATGDVSEEINVSLNAWKEEKVDHGVPAEKEISLVNGERLQDTLGEEKGEVESGNSSILNGEVNKLIEGGENDNVEITCRNASSNGITFEKESVLEDADGIQDIVDDHIKKTKSLAGNEIKEVEDPIVKSQSSKVTEYEKVNDENVNIELAVQAEQKKCEDVTSSKFSPNIEINQDSDIPDFGLVSESGEQGEFNKLSPASDSIKTQDVNKDEIKLGLTKTPSLLIEETIESKLQDGSERKIVKALETTVPLTTNLDSDRERNSIHSKTGALSETNQDSDIPDFGLVSESEEQGEFYKHSPASDLIKTQDVNKDEINLGLTEAPSHLMENATESKLEEDSEGKIVKAQETVETEVPLTTNLDSDLEQNSIHNKKGALSKTNQDSDIPDFGLVPESGEQGEFYKLSLASDSIKTQDVNKAEINIGLTEAPSLSIEDAIRSKLQEDNEGKTVKALETVEIEVPLTTNIDSVLEQNSVLNRKGADVDAKSDLCVADTVIKKWDPVPKIDTQCSDVEKLVTHSSDCHIGTAAELIFKGKTNDYSLTHLGDSFHNPEVHKQPDRNGVSPEVSNAETGTKVPPPSQSFSDSSAEDHEIPTDIKISDSETSLVASPTSIEGPQLEIVNNEIVGHDNSEKLTENCVSSDSYSTGKMAVHIEKAKSEQDDHASVGTQTLGVSSEDGHARPHTSENLKPEPDLHEYVDTVSVVTDLNRPEVIDCSIANPEGKNNIILEDVNVEGDHLCSETFLLQRNYEDSGNPPKDPVSKTSQEIGENERVDSVSKPFNYLIRIPRFNDENLKEQITAAKLEVDEKTRLRGAIQARIQGKRANNQIHGVNFQFAKDEDKSVRSLVTLKRKEIDSLQSVINKAKNAISIEDMDYRINSMEHMIQHETLPLREEKQLIREIKQLKQLREQLSSNMGNQIEIQQALEQRDEAEERLKILKKELGTLKDKVSKAQTATVVAENKCDEEHRKVKELQDEFRAADDVRQAAYVKWQSLRKQLSQKNKYFFKYRDAAAEANNHAFSRKKEALYHLCKNHVENFMELWNKSSEFRAEYVKFNTRSTVRRFGTLDGRSLGQDEKPYVLPNYATDERTERTVSIAENIDSVTQSSTPEVKQQVDTRGLASDVQSMKMVADQKNQTATRKVPSMSKRGNSLTIVSSWDVLDDDDQEEVKTKEELELIRKEEEIKRAEVEAKKKEELRLEQLAKAKEAREKKKRNEERMQMREESRARKEAELKEKEREKKMRKKERKMATAENDNGGTSEKPVEISYEEIPTIDNSASNVNKKHKKPSIANRQSKSKSIPPPLRNRNRRKLQQWMWVSLACLLIVLLFWLGNMGLFSNVNLNRRRPAF